MVTILLPSCVNLVNVCWFHLARNTRCRTPCLWQEGNGKVYYLPDSNDNTGNPVAYLDLAGIDLTFGINNTINATNIIPVHRIVMARDNDKIVPGTMELLIYK